MIQMFSVHIHVYTVSYCGRWREVLKSSAPGHLVQMQILVERMPEVAEVAMTSL